MYTIYIDGKKYQVKKSSNVLEVCLSFGIDLPYFCWHPALGSVGSCRQCAVKIYQGASDSFGRIVMACMTPVVNNLMISVYDDEVKEFRKNILELLMLNHPHDCPVCSEGGHCHLQDMTVMVGHCARRYRFMKRTHFNQNLGPFILHEMNRCINCYRCVRYYKDYAGGYDLGVYGVHDNLYFGRFQDGQLESEFSGNLIEICPTGVFTDKTSSRYYARKWDMHFSPSVCVHCSVGCNITLGERYGKLCHVENRYNSNINGYFLCDRGRFGYEYVNNLDNRFKRPQERKYKNKWIELSAEQAIKKAVNMLRDSNTIIGIGSTRASIESNFALRKLVGAKNFYIGVNRFEYDLLLHILDILQNSCVHISSVQDIENCDAILLLGEDLTQTGSRIALAIRQAVKGILKDVAKEKNIPLWHINAISSLGKYKKNPLFITSIDKTKLDDIASWTYYASLEDQARFGFAVAHAIDSSAPEVDNFDCSLINKVNIVMESLLKARKPLIISGSHAGSKSLLSSVANIAKALKNVGKEDVSISLLTSDVNSVGLAMMGGGNLDDAFAMLNKNSAKVNSLVVLETDLYRHMFSKDVDNALKKVENLIVLDHQRCSFHAKANLVFSSACIPESNGTVINQEGRAQRFFRVYDPSYHDSSVIILESWRWLNTLYTTLFSNNNKDKLNFDDFIEQIVISFPQFSNIRLASHDASFRINEQKLARAPNRYSGRTSMHANINVHEPRSLQDEDSMFTFSMEGNNSPDSVREHIAFLWAPGWNSSQAWHKFYSEVKEDLCFKFSGVRCFDSDKKNKNMAWFFDVPSVATSVSDKKIIDVNNMWHIVPYWHIFGSEEMSQRSLAIQCSMLKEYVVLNWLDAIQFNLSDKRVLKFKCGDQELLLPLIFSNKLTSGCIGLPIGFPGISFAYLGMDMDIKDIEGFF